MTSRAEAEPTDDRLLGGRIRLFQPRHGYRVAIDPVLLAAAVAATAGERVLDAGTGTAAAALCLAARVAGVQVTGLERDAELLALARRNAAANTGIAPVDLVAGDISAPSTLPRFDQAMSNPPYHRRGAATAPATASGTAAHITELDLPTWIAGCLNHVRHLGRLTLIHRAEAVGELLAALAGRVGDIVVFPLWPNVEAAAAKRVIVAARKGSRGPSRLARGLVLHGPDGRYTDAAEAILRDGAPLPL